VRFVDAGHGYDRFGLNPEVAALGDALADPLYRRYFRVRSSGSEHVPRSGPAILAANHSGTLPMDGAMLWMDVLRHTDRVPRPVADYFVSGLPLLGTLFARCGVVSGSRGNARALLEQGELLMIFPEGVPGIGKPFRLRYQLQEWRVGHVEMAIRHRAPVVPVGIVGAEEQMPQIARIPLGGAIPYLPVPATLLPLPVRYHILYGPPVRTDLDYTPDQADDPDIVRAAAQRVKDEVATLLARGLSRRKGVFS
jgi:1-acyl-sn-glycerol-3-phosphate acyltransferase